MEKVLRVLRYLSLPLFLAAMLLVYVVSPMRVPFLWWEGVDRARFFYIALGLFLALQLLFQLLYGLSAMMSKGQTLRLGKSTWTLKAFFHVFILSANLFFTFIMLYLSFFSITSQHGFFYGLLYVPLMTMFLAALGVLYMMVKGLLRPAPSTPPRAP